MMTNLESLKQQAKTLQAKSYLSNTTEDFLCSCVDDLVLNILEIEDRLNALERRQIISTISVPPTPTEDEMFTALEGIVLPKTTQEFISSLREGQSEYGFLTDKQYACLHRNYMRFVHGQRFSA